MLSLDPGIFIILILVLSVTLLFTSVVVYYTCLKNNCRHFVRRRNKHLLQEELELGKYIPIPSRLNWTPQKEDSNGSTKSVSRNFKCKPLRESKNSSKNGYRDGTLNNGFTRTPQSRVTFDFDDTIRMLRNPSGSVSCTSETQFYFKEFSSLNSTLLFYSRKTENLPINHWLKILSKNLSFLCSLVYTFFYKQPQILRSRWSCLVVLIIPGSELLTELFIFFFFIKMSLLYMFTKECINTWYFAFKVSFEL